MSKQIMQQAFENMQKNERHTSYGETQYWCNQYKMFAVRLLTELAKPEQEPVAWHSHNPDYPIQDGDWVEVIFTSGQPDDAKKWTPLYTAPNVPIKQQNINTSEERVQKSEGCVHEPVAWVELDGELVWHDINAALGRNLYLKEQP